MVCPMHRAVTVSGVAFAHGGNELVVSYNGEQIYSFSLAEHGRPAHAFQASSASPLCAFATALQPQTLTPALHAVCPAILCNAT